MIFTLITTIAAGASLGGMLVPAVTTAANIAVPAKTAEALGICLGGGAGLLAGLEEVSEQLC